MKADSVAGCGDDGREPRLVSGDDPDSRAPRAAGPERPRRASSLRRRRSMAMAAAAAVLCVASATAVVLTGSASAATTQRGPDPTLQSVAADRGTFATAEVTVPGGFGFNGGKIYYPTDTSQGTWGAIAAVPGYTATWAREGAWMGPWLASFGFVVIGIDTNSPTDGDTARGTQLLAALDYLTTQSAVRERVDANRLAVLGHSMGGGGAISAAMRRPSLKAAIPLAPASFSQNLSNVRVPMLIMGARDDGTITPSSIDGLWASKPSTTKGARVELSSGSHGFPTWGNSQVTRREIPWLKIFLDNDNRYGQFLCPSLADNTGVSRYVSECPYGTATPPTSQPPTSEPPGPGGSVRAMGAGKCLDVPGASQANNTQVQIWDCTGATQQQWTYTASKQLMVYGNKCLDASGHGRTNGTPVIIWDCGGGPNQQWTVNANGSITGVESGLCLDVTGGSTANGAPVQLWTCSGASQQQWRLDGAPPASSPPTPPPGGAPALHVSGNRLVTSSGAPYRLLGVNRSGGEFACIQGGGMWNGPMDQASINAMKTWNVRTVRVPLNEECWLGTGSVPSGGAGGATYQNNVKAYVNLLLSSGITPLLEMHWNYGQYTGTSSGCADVKATCQKPMPDAQYAPSFWTGVANAFKDNRVVFDLFNEPYPERATGNATSGWKCWRDGGTCPGIGYPVAGFQSLVNAVRATGNTNVILLGGLAYSNDLSQWLQYKPNDPTGNLGAFAHIYNFNACASTSCYDSQLAPVAAQVPLTLSEIGENDCGSSFVNTIMNWADSRGVGYLGWTWNNWNCSSGPSLISDYNGTPTAFGAGIKAHLLAQTR